jgi:predicted secreted hydrolase
MKWAILLAVVVALVVAGCGGGPVLANPPAQRPVATTAPKPSATVVADPLPVAFPRDDAPHHRLTEWWYYTGHLVDDAGGRWGFEYVVFRAERGAFPVTWASHLALTDETGKRFLYAQRAEIGRQVDESKPDAGFAFALLGGRAAAWRMSGSGGDDRLRAAATGDEVAGSGARPPFGLDLALTPHKPPALHDHDGWVDFGPGGGSYYYSRTSLTATGSIDVAGRSMTVSGIAWFDHQWGDFISVGGGWDWFAIDLANGVDLTLSVVRDRDGGTPIVYGTLVRPDGTTRHLDRAAFTVETTKHWRSPTTGTDYPAGWKISVPGERLAIDLAPTVAEQELDTRATSGVVYWEGSQRVIATIGGRPVGGQAYVELTGYASR